MNTCHVKPTFIVFRLSITVDIRNMSSRTKSTIAMYTRRSGKPLLVTTITVVILCLFYQFRLICFMNMQPVSGVIKITYKKAKIKVHFNV